MTKPLSTQEKKKRKQARKQQKAASKTVKTVTIPKPETPPNLDVNLCDDCAYEFGACEGTPKFTSDFKEGLTGAEADRVVRCQGFIPVDKMPAADELVPSSSAASLGKATVGEAEIAAPPDEPMTKLKADLESGSYHGEEAAPIIDPDAEAKRARLERFNQEEDLGVCPACSQPLRRTALNRDVDAVRCVNVRCKSYRHIIRTLVVKELK